MSVSLLDKLFSNPPLQLAELKFPAPLNILVLAPHPDDFDAIGVAMHYLHQQGHHLHVAVLTTGANGIKDGWNGIIDAGMKAKVREKEQADSCRFFGLPSQRLNFLHLWDTPDAGQDDEKKDYERLRAYIHSIAPSLVFLPHGNDSNRTHRRTYETFSSIAKQDNLQLYACMNLDAKTVSLRPDLYMYFGEKEASWKAELLRFHRSQHERNLETRGYGFDERVLRVNRQAAQDAGTSDLYAEVFELQRFA